MADEQALPKVFALQEKTRDIPWISLLIITGLALIIC